MKKRNYKESFEGSSGIEERQQFKKPFQQSDDEHVIIQEKEDIIKDLIYNNNLLIQQKKEDIINKELIYNKPVIQPQQKDLLESDKINKKLIKQYLNEILLSFYNEKNKSDAKSQKEELILYEEKELYRLTQRANTIINIAKRKKELKLNYYEFCLTSTTKDLFILIDLIINYIDNEEGKIFDVDYVSKDSLSHSIKITWKNKEYNEGNDIYK